MGNKSRKDFLQLQIFLSVKIRYTCDSLTPVIFSMSLIDIQRSCLSRSTIFSTVWLVYSLLLLSSSSSDSLSSRNFIHKLMYGGCMGTSVLCSHKPSRTTRKLLMFLWTFCPTSQNLIFALCSIVISRATNVTKWKILMVLYLR